jgi:hypothetical protein
MDLKIWKLLSESGYKVEEMQVITAFPLYFLKAT